MRGLGVVQGTIELQNGNIVVQSTSIVLGVDVHGHDVTLDVWIELNVVVDIPFAETDTQVEATVLLDAMGSGDHVLRVDQSATTSVHRLLGVLLQNGRLPRILAELTVAIDVHWGLHTTIHSLRVPGSALAQRRWWGIGTVWPTTAHMTRSALLRLLLELVLSKLLLLLLLLVLGLVIGLALK